MGDAVSDPNEPPFDARQWPPRMVPRVPPDLYERIDPEAPQEAEQRKEADIASERRRLLLGRLLAEPEGRRWLWDLLDYAHAFETRFASSGMGPDPMGSMFYAGQQNVGWHLWEQLDAAAPDLAGLMRRERGAAD